jgi:hypothetical protein
LEFLQDVQGLFDILLNGVPASNLGACFPGGFQTLWVDPSLDCQLECFNVVGSIDHFTVNAGYDDF